VKLSIVIPAHNEEQNIGPTLEELLPVLRREGIEHEIVIVNDNSTDGTAEVIRDWMAREPAIRTVDRDPPGGFGRAIRSGLEAVTGDAVVICMADRSDDPEDVVRYWRKLREGYDCVFGSRFIPGGRVEAYPPLKLVVNRIVNKCIQWLFLCPYNDLTNAFKAYRTHLLQDCGPFRASHFNITIEMSLAALVRRYAIAEVPIAWRGRTWGSSKLRLREMGRKYLSVLLKAMAERFLIADDLMAERLAAWSRRQGSFAAVERRLTEAEARLARLEKAQPEDARGS